MAKVILGLLYDYLSLSLSIYFDVKNIPKYNRAVFIIFADGNTVAELPKNKSIWIKLSIVFSDETDDRIYSTIFQIQVTGIDHET